MAEKTLKVRVQQKNDVEASWNKAVNFVPKKGELIIYNKDESHDSPRIKVGDGESNVSALPFVETLADGGSYIKESDVSLITAEQVIGLFTE